MIAKTQRFLAKTVGLESLRLALLSYISGFPREVTCGDPRVHVFVQIFNQTSSNTSGCGGEEFRQIAATQGLKYGVL